MLPCGDWRTAQSSGCRCLACRAALAAYKSSRRAQPIGTVPAARVRAHVEALAALGLGVRQVAKLAGVSARHVSRLVSLELETLRPDTAARLLAVRPVLAHGAIVPGTRTHRYLDSLRREGYTQHAIAFALGLRSLQLQLARQVRVRSALKVATVYQRFAGEALDQSQAHEYRRQSQARDPGEQPSLPQHVQLIHTDQTNDPPFS